MHEARLRSLPLVGFVDNPEADRVCSDPMVKGNNWWRGCRGVGAGNGEAHVDARAGHIRRLQDAHLEVEIGWRCLLPHCLSATLTEATSIHGIDDGLGGVEDLQYQTPKAYG